MATADFERFFRRYYRERILELARGFPEAGRALTVHWDDLYQFDPDLADDLRANPERVLADAREALRTVDVPVDVDLDRATVQIAGYPRTTAIRDLRAEHVNRLVAVRGIIRKATPVRPKVEVAIYECLTCGGEIEIVQRGQDLREPSRCPHCERNTQFERLDDRSTFVDAQRVRIQESPEGLRGGETPENIDVHLEDDLTGIVSPGDRVTATGTLRLREQHSGGSTSPILDVFLEGNHLELEEEEFEVMEIGESDVEAIRELAASEDVYDQVVDSIAPSIWGYEDEKFAMALQLFSGVRKHLPDGSRVRGDIHVLLVGDPGTGKCVAGDTRVLLGDGRQRCIRELVESKLDDPTPVDDGVYQDVDFEVPSLHPTGSITPGRVTRVWKREAPDQLVRVKTASGNELEVTPSHPLFITENGDIIPKKASQLSEGEKIALPTRISTHSTDEIDVEFRRSQSNNAVRLQLPTHWTPQLARLVGYIISEGYVELRPDNTAFISVTNNDPAVVSDISRAFEEIGLHSFERKPLEGKPAREIICSSSEFASFLQSLDANILKDSSNQRVPDGIAGASERIQQAFIRAVIAGEGSVSKKEREITIGSTSRDLLEGVRLLLLQSGIESQLHDRQGGTYRLRISGADFEHYEHEIGFITETKAEQARKFEEVAQNTNVDTIPNLGNVLRDVRQSLALTQQDFDIPRSTYQHYERGDRDPSRQRLKRVLETIDKRLAELETLRSEIQDGDWQSVVSARKTLNMSQTTLAKDLDVSQSGISYFEREGPIPDGGTVELACEAIRSRIQSGLKTSKEIEQLRSLILSDIGWDTIDSIERIEHSDDWVYDLEVAETHNYLTNGVVSHNSQLLQYISKIAPRSVYTSGKGSSAAGLTAAAVRDDFGDGSQWSLEAGALVLADQGIAAVDELDKMRPEDRSAMHEALEQQHISVSKAGINATLQARCALLGAANPKYGRFDQYEVIAEQIDLEPALISRFDLIFTVDDRPDPERDERIAEHILTTNYAGELTSQRGIEATNGGVDAEFAEVVETVTPPIEPELLRKYVAFATQRCSPTMTEDARAAIKEFYMDLRSEGVDEDSPVPLTARKLEALVRLAEAGARIRLSNEVTREDAERVIELVRSSMGDIGFDPESGTYDVDMIETGTPKTQRDRIRSLKRLMEHLEEEYDDGIPLDRIVDEAEERGMDVERVEHELDKMKQTGEIYEPSRDRYRLA